MKPPTRVALRAITRRSGVSYGYRALPPAAHHIHSTPASPATVSPIHGTGPPPQPPQPAADSTDGRLERRKKHAALLERAQEIGKRTRTPSRTTATADGSEHKHPGPLPRRRFWKHVHVREVDGALEVHLDTRPLRRPVTKEVVRLPTSKPMLAAALALEWDLLASAQQATRQHLIPLTSLACRALDIADDDAATGASSVESLRMSVTRMLMRYLDTDSLLCWAPPPRHGHDAPDGEGKTLRELQRRAAEDVVAFLTTRVWPGAVIEPALDGEGIMPRPQRPETRQIIEGWVAALSSWELAGLERAVLAGKGLLGAVRLLVEWTEGPVGVGAAGEAQHRFGAEEAAQLASIEVNWQIGNWGEVEDTHDVEKEDLRRQLGSVVLLVSGTGKK
ncbi:putative ATP12 ATPase family protein [Rosellinia necatrix]|uniref:Putative ATP12 ATPase family protein n=1 Tax=Rosellinia necatrix TaxID=77044 RepID=A0A1W2TEX0_ROSNE|nr:putative ATP12 ATPase family protein [Rosellinia necatrix]